MAIESEYIMIPNPEARKILAERSMEMVKKAEGLDAVFFLDKSARPLAYFFNNFYPLVFPGQKVPEVGFLNIGLEKRDVLQAEAIKRGIMHPNINDRLNLINSRLEIAKIFGLTNAQI